MNWPKRPADRHHLKCVFVKQPLRKATKLASKLLALLSAILFAFASTYMSVFYSHDVALDRMVF